MLKMSVQMENDDEQNRIRDDRILYHVEVALIEDKTRGSLEMVWINAMQTNECTS